MIVEVRLKSGSSILYDTARQSIGNYIIDNFACLETHADIPGWQDIKFLADEVDHVYCAESAHPSRLVSLQEVKLHIHIYEIPLESEDKISIMSANPTEISSSDFQNQSSNLDDESHEGVQDGDVAASKLELPAYRLEGIWESLIYEEGLKTKLLNYIYSSIIFAERNVNQALIAWHRLILLHGPPGTGKTSLCRSLSQKISIRLSNLYQKTELIEINSHSLFSKWFSESGKLVQSLFLKISEMLDDDDMFVIVLIDEVESLAGSRSTGTSGNEPSDALRAVNALLTELDKLKHRRNVLILTTSNLTGSIDDAFMDRADLKQYIGLPPIEAIYWILRTCLNELIKVGILKSKRLIDYKEVILYREEFGEEEEIKLRKVDEEVEEINQAVRSNERLKKSSLRCSMKLLRISEKAKVRFKSTL
ncbi:P-loop containing nucleoside triphosphate hydrolase protein [Melampsora americana]|nr:P-loop containing nucleoside triphosphate hydrolase protein [Melampsora americana]